MTQRSSRKLNEVLNERPDLALPSNSGISKSASLQIGLHIERLVEAVDARYLKQLLAVAYRLGTTAAHVGIDAISRSAKEVTEFTGTEPELADAVQRTSELLDLCPSTQSVFLGNMGQASGARKKGLDQSGDDPIRHNY